MSEYTFSFSEFWRRDVNTPALGRRLDLDTCSVEIIRLPLPTRQPRLFPCVKGSAFQHLYLDWEEWIAEERYVSPESTPVKMHFKRQQCLHCAEAKETAREFTAKVKAAMLRQAERRDFELRELMGASHWDWSTYCPLPKSTLYPNLQFHQPTTTKQTTKRK